VAGLDHKTGEVRTVAIERVRRIEALDARFETLASFDFDSYIGSSFGVIAEPATSVEIRFDRQWATYVEERTWHPSQKLTRSRDGSLSLHMEVGGSQELRTWLLSFGSGAEVLEPKALRAEVVRELKGALKRYSSSS